MCPTMLPHGRFIRNLQLENGDTILCATCPVFYIYGEVAARRSSYRLESTHDRDAGTFSRRRRHRRAVPDRGLKIRRRAPDGTFQAIDRA